MRGSAEAELQTADTGSPVNGLRGRLENQLVEIEVQPAAELEPGLFDASAEFEAESCVQSDADGVLCIDAADQGVVLLLPGPLDDRRQQGLSDAATAAILVHVDGVLHGVLVRRPRSERPIRGKAEQTALLVNRTDDWITTLLLRIEPGVHHGGRA